MVFWCKTGRCKLQKYPSLIVCSSPPKFGPLQRAKSEKRENPLMEVYKLWVRKNKEFVHSLESLANGFTWLLPERFSNSEIGPEAVYALLGILSSVNQHIIETAPARSRPHKVESSFPWSLCVSTLKDLETVVEVAAQHLYGEEGKWNSIAVVEGMKVIVRLALFRDSGYKMLLQGGEVVNAKGIRRVGLEGYGGSGCFQGYNGFVPPNLEGRAMSALSRFGENAKMASYPMWMNQLKRKSETADVSMEKTTLATLWSEKGLYERLFVAGEVLFIMRPLVYVLLIRKYGIKSWTPWLLSLVLDLTGMSILSHATNPSRGVGEKFYQLSTEEKEEIKRWKLILALYIMRDPFFTKYTKHRLEKTDACLRNVPVIGFITGKLVELLVGVQTRYTYTSGS